ncbi:Holliday junction ATP-dependent DNA helicase RuvB [bacterium HR34]|nr:Holliday junction ATP-dependent DNA helicase RuvB [bacterium HR34]
MSVKSRNDNNEIESFETSLRPERWEDFIGQEKIKENIKIIITAAKERGQTHCEHLLFYGPPGLGKTSMSYLVAKELGGNLKITSGPAIEKVGDLAAIITNLSDGDVLFIDEVHRLNKAIEEYLYPVMEDFKLHLTVGKGAMARTMELKLPKFTMIAATTRLALISSPLRDRFGAIFQFDYYNIEDLKKILLRTSKILDIDIEEKAIELICERSRFTPRIANRLLKRVRDFAQVHKESKITPDIVLKTFKLLDVDEKGLEKGDRKILETIANKFNGGPVGLQLLASATNEEEDTILDIYEPYLLKLGLIERTPKGRILTMEGYKYLKIKPANQNRIFI